MLNVLIELRAACEGFAGIPQETRLIFSAMSKIRGVTVSGLLNGNQNNLSIKKIKYGQKIGDTIFAESQQILKFKESMENRSNKRKFIVKIIHYVKKRYNLIKLVCKSAIGITIPIVRFSPVQFFSYVWTAYLDKSVAPGHRPLLSKQDYYLLEPTWGEMQLAGRLFRYPKIAMRNQDVFLTQTPFPGDLTGGARLVVRYHDAIPIFFPHTIHSPWVHQSNHYRALRHNLESGAMIVCNSENSRREILEMFPEREQQTEVVHCVVSSAFAAEESGETVKVSEIVRGNIEKTTAPIFDKQMDAEEFYRRLEDPIRYLLVVSTIEPRKNHDLLVSAWRSLVGSGDSDLRLIVVGRPGWDCGATLERMKPFQDRGMLFNLSGVSPGELRTLYAHAEAVICPSIAEGFDLPGVEAMLSGGVVVSSDIPVHREVYDGASVYFDPFSTVSLVKAICSTRDASVRAELRARGKVVGARYLEDSILPEWERVLAKAAYAEQG